MTYTLSPEEAQLYHDVTDYVRDEMNRAERLSREGDSRRGNVVGFALTVLQRRLASSPEAIYQSLRRRRERLETRVKEERLGRRPAAAMDLTWDLEEPEEPEDVDDLADVEREQLEERVVDQASAAQTIAELEHEIRTLRHLEALAGRVSEVTGWGAVAPGPGAAVSGASARVVLMAGLGGWPRLRGSRPAVVFARSVCGVIADVWAVGCCQLVFPGCRPAVVGLWPGCSSRGPRVGGRDDG